MLLPSQLRIHFADGSSLGHNSRIEHFVTRQLKESFRQFPGKRSQVNSSCEELIVSLQELSPKQAEKQRRQWQVIVRVFDDGIAIRYRIPGQGDWSDVRIVREETYFEFPASATATYLPLPGFVTSHESDYQTSPIREISEDHLLGIPLLVEISGVGAVAIAEADLTSYAGMFLKRAQGRSALVSKLSPRADQPNVAVVGKLPLQSPWRVLFVADRTHELIDSDLLLKLNAPSQVADTSWIELGKTTFPWWNGFYEEGISLESNLNTEFAKYYIDFCAEYGIPFHSLDGENHQAWYGGPIGYQGEDPTTPANGLNLQEVLAYAKKKGVKIRVWLHWLAARDHMQRAFPLYHKWGIDGVMIDFMDRNDQQMVEFQRELLVLAAENKLSVNFHGVAAPTGLERTFPHLLNCEAVKNLEYNKWNTRGILPEHEVTVPFTRMLAGPMDFHQGSLRTVLLKKFRAQDAAPLVIGTPCRVLATYVVFQNHLPMMADYPSAYRQHQLTKLIVEVPDTWDETVAVSGEVGKFVAVARRKGEDWWIGVMTNRDARELTLPLNYLSADQYRATSYQDDLSAKSGFCKSQIGIGSRATQIPVSLAPAGGALIHLVPVRK